MKIRWRGYVHDATLVEDHVEHCPLSGRATRAPCIAWTFPCADGSTHTVYLSADTDLSEFLLVHATEDEQYRLNECGFGHLGIHSPRSPRGKR